MAESNNPNNYPDPQSPEGKARAGRLYFALIVILFIFLGTVIMVHQFGHNLVEEKIMTVFYKVPVEGTEPAAEGEEQASEEAPAMEEHEETMETESAPPAPEPMEEESEH